MKKNYILWAALLSTLPVSPTGATLLTNPVFHPSQTATASSAHKLRTNPETSYRLNFNGETQCILLPLEGKRNLQSISLSGNKGSQFVLSFPATTPTLVYRDRTTVHAVLKSGERITPKVEYQTDSPLHGYLYIDYNNDGAFTPIIGSNHKPGIGSELVSYTYLDGYNSNGELIAENTLPLAINLPAFTLPTTLKAGVYRARLKVDKNSADPGGRFGQDADNIDANGGAIADFLLQVSNGKEILVHNTRNGNLYGPSNTALPHAIILGDTLQLFPKAVTSDYQLDQAVYIRNGYNLDGPQYVHGNRQWIADTVRAEDLPKTGIQVPVAGNVEVRAHYVANASPRYILVFSDEFDTENGTQPDATKWVRCQRMGSTWNRFLSDTADVAYQENGNLILKAIPNLDRSKDKVAMLTGGIESNGKFSFMYGKVECRAKVNGHRGNFPAIWMMPQHPTEGWPACGEIDIFEQIDTENKSYHTIHTNWTYTLGNKNNPVSSFSKNIEMDRYHTYGFEWDMYKMTWYVDGVSIGTYNRVPALLPNGQWPFRQPFYLILNQSVGNGSWAAPADESHTYQMDIDWIRVYQKGMDITDIKDPASESALRITSEKGMLDIHALQATDVRVNDVLGRVVYADKLNGKINLSLQKGIYMVNGKKVIVR